MQLEYWLSTQAIRDQAKTLFDRIAAGESEHFRFVEDALPACVEMVCREIASNYPNGNIPYHSRWRHLNIEGLPEIAFPADPLERGRIKTELVIVSVLLDAGAGERWSYTDRTSQCRFTRSEGLAAASLDLFARLQRQAFAPITASMLEKLPASLLTESFQVSSENPLTGFDTRLALLHRLGGCCRQFSDQPDPRLGLLFDQLLDGRHDKEIHAETILKLVLNRLGDVWPGRLQLDGHSLGDCWHHPALVTEYNPQGFIPFHKLSQWLTYSLMEPLEEFGVRVSRQDELTGLAEYRNGGLLIDSGVLAFVQPDSARSSHEVSSTIIIEWRAATIVLLDRIAELVREQLNMDAEALPLARVLQGGTWSAGRHLAFEKRSDGASPLQIRSDGSVF